MTIGVSRKYCGSAIDVSINKGFVGVGARFSVDQRGGSHECPKYHRLAQEEVLLLKVGKEGKINDMHLAAPNVQVRSIKGGS